MEQLTHGLMVALILLDLALLASRTLRTVVGLAAAQGAVLGIFALSASANHFSARIIVISVLSIIIKAIVFPILLRRATRQTATHREEAAPVGPAGSVVAATLMFGIALWLSQRLPLGGASDIPLVLPGALYTMFCGLFLIIARRTALMQCAGYVVFENGIYAFGLATVGEIPALVEVGMLADALVAVLVMGVAMYRINREFDHMDIAQLNTLRG